jgi:IS1 family transposase
MPHNIHCLVEGNSIRSTSRILDVSKCTVQKLLVSIGEACGEYLDEVMRDLPCKYIQVDEAWSFVKMKEKRVPDEKKGQLGLGDVYLWAAHCPETKLVPSFLLGRRDSSYAHAFLADLAPRVPNLVQITSDGHHPYISAVAEAFGRKIDYAMLKKTYGGVRTFKDGSTKKCKSSECSNITKQVISGNPDLAHVSTSGVERQNKTARDGMRRFTRETSGFSKKFWNHRCAVALHYMHHNFCRIHGTLRCTPAQEAGLSKHIWSLEEIAALAPITAPKTRGPYKKSAKTS